MSPGTFDTSAECMSPIRHCTSADCPPIVESPSHLIFYANVECPPWIRILCTGAKCPPLVPRSIVAVHGHSTFYYIYSAEYNNYKINVRIIIMMAVHDEENMLHRRVFFDSDDLRK